jgi:asparagine synthase (glutamine-hydrolysing)
MSGIVGIVSLDGAPVDRRLLRQMTGSLAYRGPDRTKTWVDGSVGFGHTLLRTTVESQHEEQPASLDGRVWITADARVDGRPDLIHQLESRGRRNLRTATDAQLILHAYHIWEENCVEHLLGDFAFAIWDGPARRLFCARDRFAIKPFYYAQIQGGIIFSNTLDCVRLHPGVGDGLNECAIGDFLLFGCNYEPTTTTFADIHRLPPAYSLTCGHGTLHLRRYWTMPVDGRIRYRRSQDYVDNFREILRAAVADRLRTEHVGIWLSGGLDSTSIAATAQQLRSEHGASFELRGHTIVYDRLIPDGERHYARVAAEALGVEISYFVADDHRPLDGWDWPDAGTPEPVDDPFLLMRRQQLEQSASHSRVLLCGEGGDEVLCGSHVVDLLSRMRLLELGADIVRSVVFHRRRPGGGFRARLKKWLGRGPRRPSFPSWLNRTFADRVHLRDRWQRVHALEPVGDHPLRPEAYGRLTRAPWPWYFESFDPGVTGIPVEGRYPFLDARLVSYLLAIPPLPWCIDKQLLRVTMRGALPDPIRLRPKVALAGDPLRAQLREANVQWLDRFEATPELARFVVRTAVPQLAGGCEGHDPWLHVRPLCLNYWLKRVRPVARLDDEEPHDNQVGDSKGRCTRQETV